MKKIILLIILLVMPVMVNGAVNASSGGQVFTPDAEGWDTAEATCQSAINQNDYNSLQEATNGYYLYYTKVSCEGGKNKKDVYYDFASKVTCKNGNKNPNVEPVAGAKDDVYKSGDSCTATGTYVYYVTNLHYDCTKTSGGSGYVDTTKTTKKTTATTANAGDSSSNGEHSPGTGVEDYYLILSVSAVALSGLAYVLNKKNVFKKI